MWLLGKKASETNVFIDILDSIYWFIESINCNQSAKNNNNKKKQKTTHVLVVPIYLNKSEAVHQMKSNIVLSTLAVATK